jgi:hypothetical protein
VQGA